MLKVGGGINRNRS